MRINVFSNKNSSDKCSVLLSKYLAFCKSNSPVLFIDIYLWNVLLINGKFAFNSLSVNYVTSFN